MQPFWNQNISHNCQPQSGHSVFWGYPPDAFAKAIQHQLDTLVQRDHPCPILAIAEPNPLPFLSSFIAGLMSNATTILANPHWGQTEWQQVFQTLQPDMVWGTAPHHAEITSPTPLTPLPQTGLILIPTGGSCGHLRFAVHTWATLTAAAAGFQAHFGLNQINTCCVLPLHHVSGLMQFVRSLISGGQFASLPFRDLESGTFPDFDPADFWISLVPTQLQRLLKHQRQDWLQKFQGVLLGGAPAWPSLLTQAREARIPIALTYGMSETASQVATLHPQAFLQGQEHCGRPLPHVVLDFEAVPDRGRETTPARLRVKATSLALGYYTQSGFEPFSKDGFLTDDLGYLTPEGNLHIVGRDSHKIITGGENVFPAEVEAVICGTGLVKDVCVIGLDDLHWGQVVTAIYVPLTTSICSDQLKAAISDQLARFKQPKYWLSVSALPRNPQGKVNLQALKTLALKTLAHSQFNNASQSIP